MLSGIVVPPGHDPEQWIEDNIDDYREAFRRGRRVGRDDALIEKLREDSGGDPYRILSSYTDRELFRVYVPYHSRRQLIHRLVRALTYPTLLLSLTRDCIGYGTLDDYMCLSPQQLRHALEIEQQYLGRGSVELRDLSQLLAVQKSGKLRLD